MSAPFRLQVVSDGTPAGTIVRDEEGRELADVVSVAWSIGPDRFATVTIEVEDVPVAAVRVPHEPIGDEA